MAFRFKFPTAIPDNFPKLLASEHEITSCPTSIYNCIAWAAGRSDKRWWPRFTPELIREGYYWPAGAPEEPTLEAFLCCFEILGYEVCGTPELEHQYEKVAIYTKDGEPKHAARQLCSGDWSSKIGSDVDICHELSALEGPLYGQVAVVMRRKITDP